MRISLQIFMLFVTVLILGVAHLLALEFFLYWKHPWLDIPMHLLGGVIAAFVLLFAPFLGINVPKKYRDFTTVLTFSIFVGIVWEVFEMWGGISLQETGFVGDTTLDLCMDAVGGAIGYVVGNNINKL